MNKLILFVVLIVLVCMPFASAQGISTDISSNAQGSKFLNELSLEEFLLYGGLTYENIGTYQGKACIKTGVKPTLQIPDPIDYLGPLNELQLPSYGFQVDIDYLQAQNKRLHEIIDMVDNAVNDASVQQYNVFADDPLYQNTDYGMYFTTIVDALTFGNDAMQMIGLLHDSATEGTMWLNYGYITDNADIKLAFDDYTETNLMFNGLMGQMEEYGYLEEAVGYAAGVLGGQMQQQAEAGNNIFKAHQSLDVAGDSMDRAQDFFHVGDIAGAAGNSHLETEMDFIGMMNMAEGLASAGESYKLKMLVLLMLLDGTFRNGFGMKEKIGESPGSPCNKMGPNKVCPAHPPPPSMEDQEKACCPPDCPPAYYIVDLSSACWGGITGPAGFPTPGETPLPSGIGGGAVASFAAEDDLTGLFPIFEFRKEKALDMSGWEARIPKFPAVPKEFKPDSQLVVQENLKSAEIAKDALMKIASAEIEITPETFEINGVIVQLNRQTGAFIDKDGNVIQDLGSEFAHKYNQYDLAIERLDNLNKAVGYEAGRSPIYEKDQQTYLQAKADDLTIQLDAIDREYKFQITNLRANPDISFAQRNDKINALYARTNADLIKAIENTITDEGVKRFTYLILDKEKALLDLIDLRSKTEDYSEITAINVQILEIIYPDTGIAGYYEHLKAQNMPFEGI